MAFMVLIVVLGASHKRASAGFAEFTIGLALVPITGALLAGWFTRAMFDSER